MNRQNHRSKGPLFSLACSIVLLCPTYLAVGQDKTTTTVVEQTTTIRERKEQVVDERAPARVAAIFIANRAGNKYEDKTLFFEDLVVSQVTDLDFSIISRESVLEAVSGYGGETSDPETGLDKLLADNTSALALARNLGASHIVSVSLGSFERTSRRFNDTDGSYGGISTDITQYTLRVPYKVLDATQGGSVTADTVTVSKTIRQSAGLAVEDKDLLNELLDRASVKIADSLRNKVRRGRVGSASSVADLVELTVSCSVADISIPGAVKQPDGNYKIIANTYKLEPMSVTVEIDGMVVGSAPGTFKVRPGLSKIRLSREGFKEWARAVNIYDGQVLRSSLQMDDAGHARWRENIAFLERMKQDAIITDAEAEVLRGIRKMYEQSGYKIDAKEAPDIEIHKKSLIN